jgi:hypothetical protein
MNFTHRPVYSREGTKLDIEEKAGRVPESVWMVLEKISYFLLPVFEIRTVESLDIRYIYILSIIFADSCFLKQNATFRTTKKIEQ